MAHFPKPFFRPTRGLWYIQIQRKQHNLGRCTEEEPQIRAAEMKQRLRQEADKPRPVRKGTLVVTILDAFLDWCLKHKKKRTYESYLERIQSFARFETPTYSVRDLPVDELRPFHIQEWVDSHSRWADGMKRGCIVAVQRAFNQQAKLGRIERSPIARMEKPQQGKRDQVITPEDFEVILRRTINEAFRYVLDFSWLTGARPQETIIIEARHVDLKHERIIIPLEEAKGDRFRVIYLTGPATDLVRRLIERHPDGKLFRNSDQMAWTPYAVNCAFSRLQIAHGRERMRELGVVPTAEDVERFAATLKSEKRSRGKGKQWGSPSAGEYTLLAGLSPKCLSRGTPCPL